MLAVVVVVVIMLLEVPVVLAVAGQVAHIRHQLHLLLELLILAEVEVAAVHSLVLAVQVVLVSSY
jgi:hypothetical protein